MAKKQQLAKVSQVQKRKLIVTKLDVEVEGFEVVKSIEGVDWGTVMGVIFNSCVDDDLTLMLGLSKLKGKLDFIIYINDNIPPLYFSLFDGLDADIYNGEDVLSDKDTLDFLVSKFGKTGFTIQSPSQDFQALYKSISEVLENNTAKAVELLSSDLWHKTVQGALATVDTSLARSNQINTDMVKILSKAQEHTELLKANNAEINDKLEELNATVEEVYSKGMSASPILYPTYNVPSATRRVLYIKFYSACPYLVSFIQSYQHSLRVTRSLRSKALLVLPSLPIFINRYKEIPRLATETLGVLDNKYTLCCTFEPKKSVMEKFFSSDEDVYFVLDMMYGNNLVKGAHVVQYSAVSGLKDLERFGLSAERTFFSVSGVKGGLIIPYIYDYSTASTDVIRYSLYFDKCKDLNDRLDKILGIGE